MLATVDGQIADQEGVVGDRRRENKRCEDELATQTARAADIDAKLYGGTVSEMRELQSLQREAQSLARHISSLEDEGLAALDNLETAEARLSELVDLRAQIVERRSADEATLTAAQAEIDVEVEEVSAQRAEAIAGVSPELVAEYERLRSALGGVGIARLAGNRCEGCHLTLPAVEVDRIHRLDADERVHCDECGRLLAR